MYMWLQQYARMQQLAKDLAISCMTLSSPKADRCFVACWLTCKL
jgi:hypothetical protein